MLDDLTTVLLIALLVMLGIYTLQLKNKIIELVRENQRYIDERDNARTLSLHDTLTGLANRRFLVETLKKTLAHLKRQTSETLGTLFIDLDNFKPVNDTYGHDVGDEVLRLVAERFREIAREADIIARIGGDEFVIILENNQRGNSKEAVEAMRNIAERIIKSVSRPYKIGGLKINISCSIGLAVLSNPDNDISAENVLKSADTALFEAKKNGKGMVVVLELLD